MKISVILPAYNAAQFLDEAIQSIEDQTYKDWELIIVDDSSTDNTLEIALNRSRQLPAKIKIIRHAVNKGLAASRNTGIDNASGNLILFLDADDRYMPDALELMVRIAELNTDTDIVSGKITKSLKKAMCPERTAVDRFNITIDAKEALAHVLYQDGIIDHSAWGKLYRKSLFDNLRFKEGIWYEDLQIFPRIIKRARKVTLVPQIIYLYRQHPDSFIHKWNPGRLDSFGVTEDVLRYVTDEFPELEKAARSRRMSACLASYILASRHKERDIAEQAWKVICNERRDSLSDRNVRIKNKLALLLSYTGGRSLRILSTLILKYR